MLKGRVELVLRVVEEEGVPSSSSAIAEVIRPVSVEWGDDGIKPLGVVSADGMFVELSRALNRQASTIVLTSSGRTCFYVDVGDLQPNDALEYIQKVQGLLAMKDDEVLVPVRRGRIDRTLL
jgi:hypothetical protein